MGPGVQNPYSPFKKKPGKVSSKNKESGHTLLCVGFPETNIELYQFVKVNSGQEKENYTYRFRRSFDGDDKSLYVPHLEEAGFIGYYFLRGVGNTRMNGSDGYPRYNLMRVVPGENITSPETRMEGLSVLSTFFKSITYSKYPPANIRCSDITATAPKSLDKFLLDKDIFSLLENVFEELVLNSGFVSAFPEIAPVIFGGPTYPFEAVDKLGYKETNPADGPQGSYHPSFVPPQDSKQEHPNSEGKSDEHPNSEGKSDEQKDDEKEDAEEVESSDESEDKTEGKISGKKRRDSSGSKKEPKSKKPKTRN